MKRHCIDIAFFEKKNLFRCALFLLVIALTAWIFLNSFKNYEKSHTSSAMVTDWVLSVADDSQDATVFEVLIRKFAHLFEFSCLGISLTLFTACVKNKFLYGFFLFYALAVAVTDEYIQTFSERTSSVKDIVLDFFGAVIGFLIVLLLGIIIKAVKGILKNKKNSEDLI